MSAPANAWKLGLFVSAGFAVAVATMVWLGARYLERETVSLVSFFDESVQGLDVGSPVKFRGVTIGNVSQIRVAPDKRHVQVESQIYTDVLVQLGLRDAGAEAPPDGQFVPPSLRVQLASSGITGVKFVLVDFFDPAENPAPKLPFPVPQAYIPAAPSTLKSLEESLTQTLARLPALGDKLSGLADRLDHVLVEVDAPALSRQASSLLSRLDATLQAVDVAAIGSEVTSALREAEATLSEVRALGAEVRDPQGAVQRLLADLDSAAQAAARAVEEVQARETAAELRRTAGALTAATEGAEGLTDELGSTLGALQDAARSVRELADALSRDPASLLRGATPAEPPPVGGR